MFFSRGGKQIGEKKETGPVVNPSLDTEWEIPLKKDVLEYVLFDYCENKKEVSDAATLAASSKELSELKPFKNAFQADVQKILQHTAKCDYHVILNANFDFFSVNTRSDIEEDTLYLKLNQELDIEYLYKIKPPASSSASNFCAGIIEPYMLREFYSSRKIQYSLNQQNLPAIFAYLKKEFNYEPTLKAVQMAKRNHALILAKNVFTEEWLGQRQWSKPLSALQYAAWAGDTPLVEAFLQLIPKELKNLALKQLKEVRDKHLERPHLSALKALHHAYITELESGLYKRKQWEAICKKQSLCVVNLLQWFCSSHLFHPIPSFTTFPEARSLAMRDGDDLCLENTGSFGSSWAVYKHGYSYANPGYSDSSWLWIKEDGQAIKHFIDVRKKDLKEQIANLERVIKEMPQHSQLTSSSFWMSDAIRGGCQRVYETITYPLKFS